MIVAVDALGGHSTKPKRKTRMQETSRHCMICLLFMAIAKVGPEEKTMRRTEPEVASVEVVGLRQIQLNPSDLKLLFTVDHVQLFQHSCSFRRGRSSE